MTQPSEEVDHLYIDVLARQDERTWREVEREAEQSGERSGGAFGGGFKRASDGTLRNEKGHFVKEGEEVGEASGRAAGRRFGATFSEGAKANSQQLLGILAGVATAAGGAATGLITLAGQAEQAQVAFTTLLGSGEKARAFLAELNTFAANTPFELTGLQESSKKLLAFGFQAQQIIPMMTAIGDAVGSLGGGADVLDGVVTALGQIQAKGKVSAEEMAQIAERGIPAWQFLADQMGITVPEAMKKAEAGAISAAEAIPAILKGMQDKFGGGMEAQSKTLLGMWSTTMDTMKQAGVAAGQAIVKALSLDDVLANVNKALGDLPALFQKIDLADWAARNQTAITVVSGALLGALVPALVAGASAAVAFITPLLPFLAAGAAIALVLRSMGVTLADVRTGFQQAQQAAAPVIATLRDLASQVQARLMPIFEQMGEAVRSSVSVIQRVIQGVLLPIFDTIRPHIQPLLASVGNLLTELAGTVLDAARAIGQVIDRVLIPAFQFILPVVKPVLDYLAREIRLAVDVITGLFRIVRDAINGDWSKLWTDVQATATRALVGVVSLLTGGLEKVKQGGLELGRKLVEGFRAGLDTIQAVILKAIGDAISKAVERMPTLIKPVFEAAAQAAYGASASNSADAAGHGAKAYGTNAPTLNVPINLNPLDMNNPVVAAAFQKTGNQMADAVAGWCARWVRLTLDKAEPNAKAQIDRFFAGNADDIKNRASAEGVLRKDLNNLKPGDVVVYDKNHVGVYIGNGMVRGNNEWGVQNGRGVVSNEGINALGSIAGYVKLSDVVKAQQTTPVTQQPKTGTSVSDVFPGQGSATPKTAEEIRKGIEAQIQDILARVDIGVLSKSAAIKLLSQIDAEATAVARKQGKGWQEYAATAKTADSAIESLKKGATTAKDVLGALTTQFEYAGKTGLPAYIKGLEAYIAQQEKAAQSATKGSQAQLDAMSNVTKARKALDEARQANAAGLSQSDLSKYRAGAEEVIRLEKAMATSTDVEWKRRAQNRIDAYAAQGQTAQDVLTLLKNNDQVEDDLSKKAETREKEQAALRAKIADTRRQLTVTAATQERDRLIELNRQELEAYQGTALERIEIVKRQTQEEYLARERVARAERDKAIREARNRTDLPEDVRAELVRQEYVTYSNKLLEFQGQRLTAVARAQAEVNAQTEAGAQAGRDALDALDSRVLSGRELVEQARVIPETTRTYQELQARIADLATDLGKPGVADAWVAQIEEMGRRGLITAKQVETLTGTVRDLVSLQDQLDQIDQNLVEFGGLSIDPQTGETLYRTEQQVRGIGVAAEDTSEDFIDLQGVINNVLTMPWDELAVLLTASKLDASKIEAITIAWKAFNAEARVTAGQDELLAPVAEEFQRVYDKLNAGALQGADALAALEAVRAKLAGIGGEAAQNLVKVVDELVTATQKGIDAADRLHDAWVDNLNRIGFQAYVDGLRDMSDAQLQLALDTALLNENTAEFNALLAEQTRRLKERTDAAAKSAALELNGTNVSGRFEKGKTEASDKLSGTILNTVEAIGSLANPATFLAFVLEKLNIVGSIFEGLLSVIAAPLAALQEPLRLLGELVGALIAPNLQLLAAVLTPIVRVLVAFYDAVAELLKRVTFGYIDITRDRYKQSSATLAPAPAAPSTSTPDTASGNNVIQIPTSQVTVIAAPSWVPKIEAAADKMLTAGEYMVRLAREGVLIRTEPGGNTGGGGGAPPALLSILTP